MDKRPLTSEYDIRYEITYQSSFMQTPLIKLLKKLTLCKSKALNHRNFKAILFINTASKCKKDLGSRNDRLQIEKGRR